MNRKEIYYYSYELDFFAAVMMILHKTEIFLILIRFNYHLILYEEQFLY